jgi:hypothetical protein
MDFIDVAAKIAANEFKEVIGFKLARNEFYDIELRLVEIKGLWS